MWVFRQPATSMAALPLCHHVRRRSRAQRFPPPINRAVREHIASRSRSKGRTVALPCVPCPRIRRTVSNLTASRCCRNKCRSNAVHRTYDRSAGHIDDDCLRAAEHGTPCKRRSAEHPKPFSVSLVTALARASTEHCSNVQNVQPEVLLLSKSGSLAMFTAMRRASSLVSNLAADRRPDSSS